MGVPTVTLLGSRMIRRTSASFLTALGLEQFITETPEDYINKAVSWVTTRKDELSGIRRTLRTTFKESPILNGYVPAVEMAYRSLWREYCACGKISKDAA